MTEQSIGQSAALSAEQVADIPRPNLLLAMTEVHRAAAEIFALGLTRKALQTAAPVGDGHPVMVLPGFFGGDGYSAALRRFLSSLGYQTHGWGFGTNLGPREGVLEGLQERLSDLTERYGEPVSLVGHSLGGIFARELARKYPESVRQVISLGSPFGKGRMTGSLPARLFTLLNPPEDLPIDEDILHAAPPVPTTAIYSRGDGIVNWRTTFQQEGQDQTQSIRTRGSHCGMTLNPTIWLLIAECLAAPVESWQPFERKSWQRVVYPAHVTA